jgi:hypothetical protein
MGGDAQARYHPSMKPVDRVARIRIELDGVGPPVWRTFEVPLITSLAGLHETTKRL